MIEQIAKFDNNGLVSVIIPVFNVYPYLAESLESVIHQTYNNLEIVIIDDGSTDGSSIICDEYASKDSRIRIVHQENRGLSAARNIALDMMNGKYVAFLDADDAYHPEYIRLMMNALVSKNADLVLCKSSTFNSTRVMKYSGYEKTGPLIKEGAYDRISALRAYADGLINQGVWNKLYKSWLWKSIRFPVGHVFEDTDTIYRIIDLCGKIFVIDKSLHFHRIRPDSITNTHSLNNIQDRIIAITHFETFVKRNTPEIFTMEQLTNIRQTRVNIMISGYISYMKKNVGGEKTYGEDLRKQIIETGEKNRIENYSLPTKIALWSICYSPWLLLFIYPFYQHMRQLVWKCFGGNGYIGIMGTHVRQ